MARNPAFGLTPDPSPTGASCAAPNLRRMSTFLHAGHSAAAAAAAVQPAEAAFPPAAAAAAASPCITAPAVALQALPGAATGSHTPQGPFVPSASFWASPGVASCAGSQASMAALAAVTPGMVLSMFEVAMHGLQALKRQGRADGSSWASWHSWASFLDPLAVAQGLWEAAGGRAAVTAGPLWGMLLCLGPARSLRVRERPHWAPGLAAATGPPSKRRF